MWNKLLLFFLLAAVILSACKEKTDGEAKVQKEAGVVHKTKMVDLEKEAAMEFYYEIVEHFETISIEDLLEKVSNNETFLVYIGYAECPDCRRFVPILNNVREELKLVIFYVDGSKKSDALTEFSTAYDIKYVPAFASVVEGRLVNLDVGERGYSEASIKDKLKQFINI